MNNRIHILLADNDRDFLETRVEFLEKAGYVVHCAENPEEARRLLAEGQVHLALLDIRLENDNDEQDTSGLTLAKDPMFSGIPKMMLTGFPSYQYVRDVLGPPLEGLPPAVEFLSKAEGPDAMIAAVADVVQKYLAINWELQFEWNTLLSFSQLVRLIMPDLPPAQHLARADEMEQLLRRLFNPCVQVTISGLLLHDVGRVLLMAIGFRPDGRHATYVLALGQRPRLQQEEARYREMAPDAAKRYLHLNETAQTVHLGAIAYTWHGEDLADLKTLATYLQQPSLTAVRALLHHLYQKTLRPWYENGRTQEPATRAQRHLQQRFQFPTNDSAWSTMQARLESLCTQSLEVNVQPITLTETRLEVHFSQDRSLSLPHPVVAWRRLESEQAASALQAAAAHWGITHGQVLPHAVWVTPRQHTALLDLSHAGRAPLLVDFVSLETAVKFDLGLASSLDRYVQLEQKLLNTKSLNEPVADNNLPADARALLLLLQEVRYLAAELAGCDMFTYRLGLFYYALAHLQRFQPDRKYVARDLRPYVQALLSAALLANDLIGISAADLPEAAQQGIHLDEDRQAVWVLGRREDLTVQEYQILAYLIENAGQLCRREEIIVHGLGEAYDEYQEDSRLNSAMSRLRQKIESDPRKPRFLKTVRGSGYRLDL